MSIENLVLVSAMAILDISSLKVDRCAANSSKLALFSSISWKTVEKLALEFSNSKLNSLDLNVLHLSSICEAVWSVSKNSGTSWSYAWVSLSSEKSWWLVGMDYNEIWLQYYNHCINYCCQTLRN